VEPPALSLAEFNHAPLVRSDYRSLKAVLWNAVGYGWNKVVEKGSNVV